MLKTQPRYLLGSHHDSLSPAVHTAEEGWLTYAALAGRIDEFSRRLSTFPRSLVFLFGRNDLPSLVAYMAAVEAGHAVALLEAEIRPEAKRQLLDRYQPEWLLEVGDDRHDGAAELVIDGEVRAWRARAADQEPPHPDLAVLLSTSGSTGSPKFVRLSRRNLESNALAIAAYLDLGPHERALASLPMPYAYGLSVVNSHLLAGGSLVLTRESVLSRAFWAHFEETGCTSFAGVPYTYQILERIGFEGFCPATLRTMTQAGGKLDDGLIAKYHALMVDRGGRFVPMYGQTEATARIAYLPADRLPEKLGSVGVAVPGGALSLERDGRAVETPFAQGEVIYQGPNVMLGYATCRADLARGDDQQGRLKTGDLGYFDQDGFLYVCGREKRIAKLFGLRVSLDEVESMLRPSGPTAVLDGGDHLGICCEYGDDETFHALARELARSLKLPIAAFRFRRLPALPLLASGKVDYAALKELES